LSDNFSEFDIKMTRRALELASFGIGQVSPSPLVGCVIVAENGETIGEGTYIYENVTHAEVLALNQAGEKAKARRLMFRLSRTRIRAGRSLAPKR
jgi:diaminohydroxyphosphoribosylaminopyrimidine deaminase/5-amino-6-(5-phosphoribosylamino)uracil reductase